MHPQILLQEVQAASHHVSQMHSLEAALQFIWIAKKMRNAPERNGLENLHHQDGQSTTCPMWHNAADRDLLGFAYAAALIVGSQLLLQQCWR